MTQGISDKFWQAEARTEETKQFIRDIRRITRRKFTPEEKIRIVLEGFRRDTPSETSAEEKESALALTMPGQKISWRLVRNAFSGIPSMMPPRLRFRN